MTAIYAKVGGFLLAILLVFGLLYGAYYHGVTVTDSEWRAKWNARNAQDEATQAVNEAAERTKEQARQQAINKVVQNGQVLIDSAVAAVAVANRESDRLRDAADTIARRVSASQGSGNSCTAATSAAATRAVMVLADVLKRADQRAGDLAATADQARARGVTCEQAYDSLGK